MKNLALASKHCNGRSQPTRANRPALCQLFEYLYVPQNAAGSPDQPPNQRPDQVADSATDQVFHPHSGVHTAIRKAGKERADLIGLAEIDHGNACLSGPVASSARSAGLSSRCLHSDNDVCARPYSSANGCHQTSRFPVKKSKSVAGDIRSV